MRLIGAIALLVLVGGPVSAQAPTSVLVKLQEAEQRALAALQATDAYKLFKVISEARQQQEALMKAEAAKAKEPAK
jgi:hypothetical protein